VLGRDERLSLGIDEASHKSHLTWLTIYSVGALDDRLLLQYLRNALGGNLEEGVGDLVLVREEARPGELKRWPGGEVDDSVHERRRQVVADGHIPTVVGEDVLAIGRSEKVGLHDKLVDLVRFSDLCTFHERQDLTLKPTRRNGRNACTFGWVVTSG